MGGIGGHRIFARGTYHRCVGKVQTRYLLPNTVNTRLPVIQEHYVNHYSALMPGLPSLYEPKVKIRSVLEINYTAEVKGGKQN